MEHPKTYKAYAFTEAHGALQAITKTWADPQPGEVIVKVLACGVCAGDELVPHQLLPTGFPRVPGHEIVGDVAAVHSSERHWRVGQRVGAGWHGGHCGICTRCREGDFTTCEKDKPNGIMRDGGYAEYATIQSDAVVAVPEELDPADAAPLLCAGVTMFNALRHTSALPPAWVAVQGIGGLGHLGIQFAAKMGFRVAALSSSASKRELAQQLGATRYIDTSSEDAAAALQGLGGARVVLGTAPDMAGLSALVPAMAVNGEIVILAPSGDLTIPTFPLLQKRVSVRGWPGGAANDSEDTLQFALAHGVKCMVQRFPLDKAQEAYEHRSSARFRAVIVPGI